MGRVILSSVLAAATLLGPMLCCCTLTPLLNAVVGNSLVSTGELAKAHRHSCCGHHTNVESNPDRAPAQKPCDHKHPAKCPCKEHPDAGQITSVPSPTVISQFLIEANSSLFTLAPFSTQTSVTATVTMLPCRFEAGSFPYATGRDILRALHILQI